VTLSRPAVETLECVLDDDEPPAGPQQALDLGHRGGQVPM